MRIFVKAFLRQHFVLYPIVAIVLSHQVLNHLNRHYETVENLKSIRYGILINQHFSVILDNYIVIASYNKDEIPIKNHAFLQLMRV